MTSIEREIALASLHYRLLTLVDYHKAWTTGNIQGILNIWEEALDARALGKLIALYQMK